MRKLLPSAVGIVLLAGCTVGPDYKGPSPLPPPAQPGAAFVRGSEAVSPNQPVLAQWWLSLGDPVLNTLEARALAGNPGLEAAQARIEQARQNVRYERAQALPTGAVQGTYIYADLPGLDLGSDNGGSGGGAPGQPPPASTGSPDTTISFFNLGLNANWEIDLWGKQRRIAESTNAQLGAAVATAADAQVQLTAEVAQAYVNLRERQHRLASLERARDMRAKQVELAEQRYRRGATAAFPVEQAKTQLNAVVTDITSADAERESYLNALAVLTGAAPGTVDTLLAPPAAIPLPPAQVAVGDPASLIARRPDVRAAERNIAAANAQVGAIEAARLPTISFMGILGIGGPNLGDLFDLGNVSKIAMPQLQWGALDFGRSLARLRQARSAREEAEAKYRQAVLAALQDAETSLSRFGHQRQTVAALAQVAASADRSAKLMRERYDAGAATLSDALDAERQALEAERNLAAATAALTGSFVAVQKSLGLGWQQAPPPADASR
jgi:NodT family efflux transporter outer membrane factor (OMF) lipoprotein